VLRNPYALLPLVGALAVIIGGMIVDLYVPPSRFHISQHKLIKVLGAIIATPLRA
jgi:hypothetical protein